MRLRGSALLTGAVAVAALVVAACVPPTGDPGSTTTTTTDVAAPPVVTSFSLRGAPGNAPAVVALAWAVSDPNGDPLTCRIDGNGDGVFEVVITNCPENGSRNVVVPTAGAKVARFQVDDGTFPPVESTRAFTVGADPGEPFNITLRGVEELTAAQAAAFTTARNRWEAVLARGVPDRAVQPRPACLPADVPDLPVPVDDIVIDVSVVPIDGVGGILGQAGPTCITLSDELPLHGIMEFDSADVANLISQGRFTDVVLHEMAHVFGIGTLWDLTVIGGSRKVINGVGSSNPRYTGGRGVAEWSALGQVGNVPVENTGGPGTQDAHWRESVFGNELMTGFLNAGGNPLSRLSIASMVDLGFQVDLSQADPYVLPGGAAGLRQPDLGDYPEVLRPPLGGI